MSRISYRKGIMLLVLLLAFVGLGYIMKSNPHQNLQQGVMQSAKKIHDYYRDQPGYWQLSTNTAKEDGLIATELLQYTEYDVQVGQGLEGESGLPSDLSFNIVLKNLNKSACINLSEMPIDINSRLLLQQIQIINSAQQVVYTWGGNPALPIGKYWARHICEPRNNMIVWTFQ